MSARGQASPLDSSDLIIYPLTASAMDELYIPRIIEPNNGNGPRTVAIVNIDPLAVGDTFHKDKWPLRVTLLSEFQIDPEQWDEFDAEMPRIIDEWGLIHAQLSLGDERFYGDNEDTRVRAIDFAGTMHLYPLHIALFALVHRLGASFDQTYAGPQHYSPHTTVPKEASFEAGDIVHTQGIAIIEKSAENNDERIVKRVFAWDKR